MAIDTHSYAIQIIIVIFSGLGFVLIGVGIMLLCHKYMDRKIDRQHREYQAQQAVLRFFYAIIAFFLGVPPEPEAPPAPIVKGNCKGTKYAKKMRRKALLKGTAKGVIRPKHANGAGEQ